MKKILVIGSINVDEIYTVDELPKMGQTVISSKSTTSFGGKGANQAFAIGQMNGDVELLGIIGDDENGRNYLHHLKTKSKVKHEHIIVSSKDKTGTAMITVDKTGHNTIVVSANANHDYGEHVINKFKKKIDAIDILVLQLEIPMHAVEEFINYAFEKNKMIILNPAPGAKLNKNILSKVDFLIPNETELEILTGKAFKTIDDIKANAREFQKQYNIKNLLVTMGEWGSYIVNKIEDVEVSAIKVKAVDTTCAGDSYLGAFVQAIAEDKHYVESMWFASKVASIVVTKHGAQESIPNREEVE